MATELIGHIETTPGVSGGKPRIAGHRITVQDIVIWHERMGLHPDEIAKEYGLSLSDICAALADLVADLLAGDVPFAATEEEKLVTRVCKRAAIKAGQVLSHAEMQELARQLEACRSPRTCPHGRPTMIHLSAEQLAKEFGRR